MGRKVAIPWHASFSIAAGVLYFFFVLPRWPELMGDTTHSLGTALRIVAGVLVALAALPVVFTLLRTRKPELGTPQLALSLRVASIVAHVLAGLLIIGTAVSEIWLSLDAAGRWLFGIYGAAAAIALLGIFAFYLSFVAELPPPPPKPIKAKKPKKRRLRRKKAGEEVETAETAEAEEAEAEEADETEAAQTVTAETEAAEATEAAEDTAEAEKPAATEPEAETPVAEDSDESRAKLRNRRPTGKGTHRMRRRR
ncbi:membrane protein, partial [Mycobacterium avium subsp. hominissuis 10-5606]